MTVKELFLEGFRNYSRAAVEFCGGTNVITGRNAQGKTNLIEAIYYLASGRTFRQAADKELIAFDTDNAYIRADIEAAGRRQTLEARFFRGKRRQLLANGAKLKKASELAGKLAAVVFCPDDLCIVKDGASVRRKLMDNSISQLRPGYAAALSEFGRLYEHKTRILRDHFDKPALLELLDDFSSKLIWHSAQLIYYRAAFAQSLARRASEIHREFSGGQESLDIKYKTVGGMDPAGKKPEDIVPMLDEHQREHREAEIRSGMCLSGAHKDDLEIEINGKPARKYASQGQARTTAVSVKLAERDIHYEDRGEYPVLLLDDVLSELDSKRRTFILGKIGQGQVFITCCDDTTVGTSPGGKVLRIEKGNVLNG